MSDCPLCQSDAEAQRLHEIEVKAGARGYLAGWNDAIEMAACTAENTPETYRVFPEVVAATIRTLKRDEP